MPTGLSVTAISCNTIILKWNASFGATNYDVYSCEGTYVTSVPDTTYTITSLNPVRAYSYRIRATNTHGHSSFTECQSATTHMCDTAFHWGVNNYPWKYTGGPCMDKLDPYGCHRFQCTSYVSWKINNFLGDTSSVYSGHNSYPFNTYMNGGTVYTSDCNTTEPKYRLSNACHYAVALQAMGYVVDNIPAVGAIAQWDANENGAGSVGHVGFVDSVSGNYVYISNYNGFDRNGRNTLCDYGIFGLT